MGSLDGVYATSAAWRDGHEVVSLLFDPQEIEYQTLVEKAKQFKCTSKVFAYSAEQLKVAKKLVGDNAVLADKSQNPRMAKGSDQKYYLANSPLRSLPMCGYQMTKLNAALRLDLPVKPLLSPRQVETVTKITEKLKTDPNALHDFVSPIDDNQLGAYAAKLETVLAK